MQGETSDEVLGAVKLLADSVPDGGSYVQVPTGAKRYVQGLILVPTFGVLPELCTVLTTVLYLFKL